MASASTPAPSRAPGGAGWRPRPERPAMAGAAGGGGWGARPAARGDAAGRHDDDRDGDPEPEVDRADPEVVAAQLRLGLPPDQEPGHARQRDAGERGAQHPRRDGAADAGGDPGAVQDQDDRVQRDGYDGEVGRRTVQLGEVEHGAMLRRPACTAPERAVNAVPA